ncbi:MFS general substrate transporter [Amanita rubescens]|nr:MFS general substrate transporter [Amanita rubescens]
MASAQLEATAEKTIVEESSSADHIEEDSNVEFGGTDARKVLEKRLLLKLDLRMSIMVVIYILNYIDRNNASAARLRGLQTDLHLHGQEFATLLSILYVGYIIMQIPSNMFLNYIGRPSLYLPLCMMVWGMISCLTALSELCLLGFYLGFVEAAFFPGALFLLTKWYKRDELGLRTAILLGHAAWRWLFYIEGSLTIFVAAVAIFVLPDFPTTTRWLTPQERALAIKRMEEDVGVNDHEETGEQGNGLWLAITDWKVWWLAFLLTSQVVALSFNAYFPTLTATLGYNPTISLVLVAPPFLFTTILSFFWSRHSDKTQERFWHMSLSFGIGIVGFIISIATTNIAARYVSMFLMAQSYAGFIVLYAWVSNTIARPASKRAVSLALINAFSQLGNVAGSYVWPLKWGPTYRKSYAICIATSGCAIVMGWMFRKHLEMLNRQQERSRFRYIL